MAWDDTAPTPDELGSSWDATPPTDDELNPKSVGGLAENALSNLGRDINPINIAEGLGNTVKQGLYDIPKAAVESSVDLLKGAATAATGGGLPSEEDVANTPILAKTREMVEPIAKDPVSYAYKNPLDAAMLVATPFLAGMGGEEAAEAPEPREPPPPPPPGAPPEPPPGGPSPSAEAPKEPVQSSTAAVPPKADPLKDVKDWIASKGEKVGQKPGIVQKIGNYLDEEAARLGGKDLGLQLGQVKSMGPGFEGLEKGKALISYAREKGYLDPSLSDTSRRTMIQANMDKSGAQLGALRDLADQRGVPPVDTMREALKTQLEEKFGIDAPGEISKVMAKFDKAAKTPTFSGMADLATDLHKSATPATKMGLHPGPTTEGANILARMNNEATRATFNPEEGKMFTESLRDFGANKKLEQAVAAGGRKALVGRGAPGSLPNRLVQEVLDRGGYRLGGNIADKLAGWTKTHPQATLPQFFEELAHQSDQTVDDAINGMSRGGRVSDDVRQYVGAK